MFEFKFDDSILTGLNDKVIIITGASSGVGLAAATFFSDHGAQVVAVDLNPLPKYIHRTTFRKVDVTNWNEQYDLFQWTSKTFGHIDIAFLNAGVAEVENIFVDQFDDQGILKEPRYKTLEVNLKAPINGTKLAIHFMKNQKEPGSIVITGSGKCFDGVGGTPMYAVSKHGLLGLVRTLRTDIPPDLHIRINLMCPFWTDTGLLSPEQREKIITARECMQSADVPARAVAYLSLSPDLQGVVLYAACGKFTDVDKGYYLARPIWLGAKNHLDRVSFEEDPSITAFKTKFA